jgi:glycosyltransferase involved in cell wall biosynthesis
MPGYQGLFVDSLARVCTEVICFLNSPLAHELPQMDYPIMADHVHLVSMGPHSRVPVRTARAYLLRGQPVGDWQNRLDVLLVRAPTPLLPVLASAWKKPMTLLVVGDYLNGIDDLPQPAWRKELIRWWARWNQSQQLHIAKRCLTFVNSRVLYQQMQPQLPDLIETQTTTLDEGDFYERVDTCATPPYHLLYTGRIDRAKGLFEIIHALAQLIQMGFDVILNLVGLPAPGDTILDEIAALAQSLGIAERVVYHGYKKVGSELLSYYRQADIYVTASRKSEGFPRTIWEAMASSLPVVSTQVGSIPAFAGDSVLLVPPMDVTALTQAIASLFSQADLRRELIRKGLALAHENTLQKRASEMVAQIETWMHKNSATQAC